MKMNWCTRAHSDEDECGNWLCACGHLRKEHWFSWKDLKTKKEKNYMCTTNNCFCRYFRFVGNDNCEIECLFKKKLEDAEGV